MCPPRDLVLILEHPEVQTKPVSASSCAALASRRGLGHSTVTRGRTGQSGLGDRWHILFPSGRTAGSSSAGAATTAWPCQPRQGHSACGVSVPIPSPCSKHGAGGVKSLVSPLCWGPPLGGPQHPHALLDTVRGELEPGCGARATHVPAEAEDRA